MCPALIYIGKDGKGMVMTLSDMEKKAKKPFLGPFDFLRLIRSSAYSVVKNAYGSAPLIPHVLELERYGLGDLGLTKFIPAMHSVLTDLLDLEALEKPEASVRFSAYAENLTEAFDRKETRAFAFYDKDALGAPRKTLHTIEMLLEEAGAAAFLFSGRKRVLVTTPLLHSFGFIFGLLTPRLARLPAIDMEPYPDLSGYPLQKGDEIVVFPQLLRKLTLSPPPDVSLISSASPPLDDGLFKAARNVGYLSLTEVYGTSLTGALGWRKGAGPYELFSHFERRGEKSIVRLGTGKVLSSSRLIWRRERHFSRFDSNNPETGGGKEE